MLKVAGVERQRGHVVLRFMAGDRVLAALGRALVREAAFNKVDLHNLCFAASLHQCPALTTQLHDSSYLSELTNEW